MSSFEFNRRSLMRTSAAAALGASVVGTASADVDESETSGAPYVDGELKRFSTTAHGAEMTGPFVFQDGTLLHSVQHPSKDNPAPYNEAGIGYYKGFSFSMDGSNDDFDESPVPETEAEQDKVLSAAGNFEFLIQGHDEINGGTERFGVPQTPDGTDITTERFAGARYGDEAYNPDCNQFVPTNDDGTEGYVFTNWENSPGCISRVPISKTSDGKWEADKENAMNLVNTQAFRDIGGTRINCYGDRSPWMTMISSEEQYAQPRTSLKATVSDIEAEGTGKGLLGAGEFWNRPNPSKIQEAVDSYYGDNSWYVQGYWNATGVEHLAYHLGADPVDQADNNSTNTTEPIGDVYPNQYRYGYHVDIRDPAADEPTPVKYWVMGRSSWEAPNIQADEKTVYQCADGDSKGIYKFVAEEPIPSYDNTDDIKGTLYAPKIETVPMDGADTSGRLSPADAALEIDWMPMGTATNGEVESWIAQYDDVTQVDYLETHADTDWQNDLATALEEADKEVIANGNQNYITHEEILQWAQQYEANGPDGVDEDLRKVPFLETREAAKEIGASIEFNKAEGVDSKDGAGPGEYVYFGISEFNDAMADDQGDIQLDRVDGGVVYRGELDTSYNVDRLEPAVVGPDFTDSPEDADDGLRNIDNVYAMADDRVLCCEDGFGGPARSYPNDGMYVYEPQGGATSQPDDNSGASPVFDTSESRFAQGNLATAADVDGDGYDEDLDGDGDVDNDDVAELLAHKDDEAVQNSDAYDFDDDGDVGISDVVDLWEQANEN